MRCPFCDADKDSLKVIDSRACEGGTGIRRRRECLKCSKRFTTYERVEDQVKLIVVKKDGSRVPWERSKVMNGLERACYKRPVEADALLHIVEEVEDEIFRMHDKEVPSTVIGSLVSDHLRRLDQVAYVRFASVYRQFRTLEDLMNEARAVIDAQQYETPGQWKLFLDPPGIKDKTQKNGQSNGTPLPVKGSKGGGKKKPVVPTSESAEPASGKVMGDGGILLNTGEKAMHSPSRKS